MSSPGTGQRQETTAGGRPAPIAVVVRKIRRAVTDDETEVRYDPEAKPGVSNLIEILGACTGEKAADLAGMYDSYGELKNDCAEAVVGLLRPIQQRYRDLGAEGVMKTVLRDGATRAAELADAKLRLARANAGLFAP